MNIVCIHYKLKLVFDKFINNLIIFQNKIKILSIRIILHLVLQIIFDIYLNLSDTDKIFSYKIFQDHKSKLNKM